MAGLFADDLLEPVEDVRSTFIDRSNSRILKTFVSSLLFLDMPDLPRCYLRHSLMVIKRTVASGPGQGEYLQSGKLISIRNAR
jgi:hypothetical protein